MILAVSHVRDPLNSSCFVVCFVDIHCFGRIGPFAVELDILTSPSHGVTTMALKFNLARLFDYNRPETSYVDLSPSSEIAVHPIR